MKKCIYLLLCLMLALALAGCGKTEPATQAEADGPFLVGYGRSVITPETGTHMAGNMNPSSKLATGVYDDLYATCIAFTDATGETVLLFHMDLQRADLYSTFARSALSEALGIPMENIIIASTHTHSGPQTNYFYNDKYPRMTAYEQNVLQPGILAAAEEALADRKPARMYGASTNPEGLNFVRHYILSDGTVAGDHFGSFAGNTIVSHVSEADNQMQLLCFKREGGKDVVLMNWQAHAHRSGINHTNYTADIVGSVRSYMEAELDCCFAYFIGAAGNVNSSSRISTENITDDYIEQGQELAKYAIMALEGMTELTLGRVQVLTETGRADAADMPVSAFSIGDAGFAIAPYEMFTENGQAIKRGSPFETTFVVTCANGRFGYFPSKASYAYNNYEYESNHIPQGNAEEMADLYIKMLETLHTTRTLTGQTVPADAAVNDDGLYWNLHKPADGTVQLLHEGQTVTLKADDELLARMENMELFGLTLEGDTIKAVHTLLELPTKRISTAWYVESMKGNILTLNSHVNGHGKALVVTVPEGTPVWSITKAAPMTRQLQATDRVTVVTDESGTPTELFAEEIAIDVSVLETETRYCTHCKLDASFYIWNVEGRLPNADGHYLLQEDVAVETDTKLISGNICLDLNGKTVTQKTFGTRIYVVEGAVNFALMDSVGDGRIVAANSDKTGATSGMIVRVNNASAKFYLYSGTLDAENTTCEYSCCVYMKKGYMEMHGGTMLGGTTYGSGSSCIAVGELSEFVMYGGKMVGGLTTDTDFVSSESTLIKGGVIMRVTGTATIYDGIFIGGHSELNGGGLYVKKNGSLYLLGGTVSGGSCDGVGAGLYVEDLGTLVIGSGVTVTDNKGTNLCFAPKAMISVHSDGLGTTKIGVSATESCVFLKGSFTAADAVHFISNDPTMKIVVTDEGLALQKK